MPTITIEIDSERARRVLFVGLIAWVSVCLLVAGWGHFEPGIVRIWTLTGLVGLGSALGLSEVLQRDIKSKLLSLQAASTTDPLTGIGNRRLLDTELERRLSQLKRQGTIVSLLLIDVDHFKQINDVHGHIVGDEILKGLARDLDQTLRDMDLVTRYGGEEFAAVLPGTDLAHAKLAAERVRALVERSVRETSASQLQATISIGVAQASHLDTPQSLLQRADGALYAAKQAGRNRCYFSNGIDEGYRPV